ncbi:glycerophosphodiester phosphodiesterase family protein, partial [Variovorax sp. LT2P21]|uniref:glycerophosphodiester phosphodiesterase family protein n=1 Tax=Variovorax sp. LT2P21 TaxID=3443731 RepID=UPI003F49ABD2
MALSTPWPYPRWVAHRGAGKLAPENTLAAFKLGAAHGYRMFECDAKLSADGVVFLMHDATLGRTTSGHGIGGAQPWSELAQLDAGGWHSRSYAGEPLPTLENIARFCLANGHLLNIEIKPTPGVERETGEVVAREAARLWQGATVPPLLTSFQVESLKGALFPMRLGPPDLRHESEDFYVGHTLDAALQALLVQARLELNFNARHEPRPASEIDDAATEAVRRFANALPSLRRLLDSDVLAAYQGDPAARSVDEVLLCYPGVLAMIHHRLAHELYKLGLPLLARIVAELSHAQTGIDIHPGAQIDEGFFIDHGTGVVIGET